MPVLFDFCSRDKHRNDISQCAGGRRNFPTRGFFNSLSLPSPSEQDRPEPTLLETIFFFIYFFIFLFQFEKKLSHFKNIAPLHRKLLSRTITTSSPKLPFSKHETTVNYAYGTSDSNKTHKVIFLRAI